MSAWYRSKAGCGVGTEDGTVAHPEAHKAVVHVPTGRMEVEVDCPIPAHVVVFAPVTLTPVMAFDPPLPAGLNGVKATYALEGPPSEFPDTPAHYHLTGRA